MGMFNKHGILDSLEWLSDWLQQKAPGERFELVLVGGAALALEGLKDQTVDIDLFSPDPLPEPIQNGAAHIGRVRKLGPEWINTNVAVMLRQSVPSLPDYFRETSRSMEIGRNLRVHVIGRQALISLKLYAASPVVDKHTKDLAQLEPERGEIEEAVRFVLSVDGTEVRRNDLSVILERLGFEGHDVLEPTRR